MSAALVERIESLLPQTQCARCGFEGCGPYAEALAAGAVALNRCVPGGQVTVEALSRLLERPTRALDLGGGGPAAWRIARVDEDHCIGCAVCLRACPVDAILGARKLMHTVIAHECTGCELCVPACPVDCIHLDEPCTAAAQGGRSLTPDDDGFLAGWLRHQAPAARARHARRRATAVAVGASAERSPGVDDHAPLADPPATGPDTRRAIVDAAVARARARRARPRQGPRAST